jgi:ribosome maturation factor RimP
VATSRLAGLVEPVATAAGYDLEELVVRAAGQRSVVRVVVDRDQGVTLDDVAEFSRALSEVLDADGDDLGRSPYVLEVTSPGVDRPLTAPRHWRRNTGRLVTVEVGPEKAREHVTARVVRVDDDAVVLAVEKGNAKKGQLRRATVERTVPWAELGEARVQVEFSRPAGHRDAALVATVPDDAHDAHDAHGEDDEDLVPEHGDDEPADEPGRSADDEPHTDHQQHHPSGPAPADASRGAGPAPRRASRSARSRPGGEQ